MLEAADHATNCNPLSYTLPSCLSKITGDNGADLHQSGYETTIIRSANAAPCTGTCRALLMSASFAQYSTADVIRIAIAFDARLVSAGGRVRVVMARTASGTTRLASSSAGAAATTPLIHASDVAHRPQERIVDAIAIGLAKADGKLGQDRRMARCQKGTSDRVVGAWCFVQRRIGGKSR